MTFDESDCSDIATWDHYKKFDNKKIVKFLFDLAFSQKLNSRFGKGLYCYKLDVPFSFLAMFEGEGPVPKNCLYL